MRQVSKKRGNAGETIVEVTVSTVIFLLVVAMLQGAVSFCGRAQQKSRQIRYNAAEVAKALRRQSWPENDVGTESFDFYAVGADGTKGYQVFSVEAVLKEETVDYEAADGTSQSMTFRIYRPLPEGGGSP